MRVIMVKEDKAQYLDLLRLADEQDDMIYKYLNRGDMFSLYDNDLKSTCVVTQEGENIYEIKNIATYDKYQGLGYGQRLIEYILNYYEDRCKTMYVGTGDIQRIISFYERCGFRISHRVKNFFIDNYNEPIFECGKQLIDMVYLKKEF